MCTTGTQYYVSFNYDHVLHTIGYHKKEISLCDESLKFLTHSSPSTIASDDKVLSIFFSGVVIKHSARNMTVHEYKNAG